MNSVFYQIDQVEFTSSKITADEDPIHGPMTVFHDVVIASEMVQPYEDGRAWKPAEELEKSYWTWDHRWIVVGGHPDTPMVMSKDDVNGRTVNPRFVKNLKDSTGRPQRRGVVYDLQVFNKYVSPQSLEDMKNGEKAEVSIAFFFNKDEVGGIVQDGAFKGIEYDYVQRGIFGEHTAAGISDGRCPMPYCGIGADELIKGIAQDPFAGFKNMNACIEKFKDDPDVDDPGALCGYLEQRSKKKSDAGNVLNHLKSKLNDIESLLETFREVEEEKMDESDWWKVVDWKKYVDVYEKLDDELKTLITDAGGCPTCDEETEEEEEIEEEVETTSEESEDIIEETEEEESSREDQAKPTLDPYVELERAERILG